MNIDRVLDRLDKVRKSGDGWIACCPAHNDRSASLAVSERDGKILLNCFAGCTFGEVVSALGMEEKDMFAEEFKPVSTTKKQVYFSKKHLDEIDMQCWFCAVAHCDIKNKKRVEKHDLDRLYRCLNNLKKQLGPLLDLKYDTLALRVFNTLCLFFQNYKGFKELCQE